MKGKLKQTKGITLIALIITIIILLILAVVSISLVINNGILDKSKNAVDKYSKEEMAEKVKLAYSDYQMSQYTDNPLTFQQALANAGLTDVEVTGNDKDGYDVIIGDKIYQIDPSGNLIVGNKWSKNEDGTFTQAETGKTVKIGDYVNYDPTAGATTTSVKSEAADNGYGDQTFNLASYKNAGYGWRVLGIENGKIQLISEEFIGPDEGGYKNDTYNRTYYYLQGQAGYINGVNELNKICSMYGQGKGAEGARSITVEDVNKITGYDPETVQYGKGEFYEYENKVTYTRGEGTSLSSSATNEKTWSGNQETFNYYDETTRTFKPLTSGSTDITSTSYVYGPATLKDGFTQPTQGVDENGTYNEVNQMLFGKYTMTADSGYYRNFTGTGAPQSYWLASSYADASSSTAYWGMRIVDYGGVYGNFLYGSLGYTCDYFYGVRAVVSLKSDVQLSASGENNWNIN